MDWYYAQDSRQQGPVSEEAFRQLVADGVITRGTLVWQEGMAEWQPYATVAATMATPGAGLQENCVECGGVFAQTDMVFFRGSWVCARCKPVFFQRLQESGEARGQFTYAGFWVRFCAKFVDGLICGGVNTALGLLLGLAAAGNPERAGMAAVISTLLGWVFQLTYNVWFLGRFGATPGKMALGLKVIRSSGDPLTYGRALGRVFAEFISAVVLMLGYIMAAFDSEKRALHDHICDTRVVRK